MTPLYLWPQSTKLNLGLTVYSSFITEFGMDDPPTLPRTFSLILEAFAIENSG